MMPFTLADLETTIADRASSDAAQSYTRSLLDKGAEHCAKKFGEEAVETIIAACGEDRAALIAESADLMFHWLVLLRSRGVKLAEVEAALATRTAQSGHAEKTARLKP